MIIYKFYFVEFIELDENYGKTRLVSFFVSVKTPYVSRISIITKLARIVHKTQFVCKTVGMDLIKHIMMQPQSEQVLMSEVRDE